MYKSSKVRRGKIQSRPQSCLAVKKDTFIYFCLYLSVREEWEQIVLCVCVCVCRNGRQAVCAIVQFCFYPFKGTKCPDIDRML